MSDPRFLQDGFDKRLAHLIEECGELLAAAGKTQRWGPLSVNPLLPPMEQVTNIGWIRAEAADVRQALDRFLAAAAEEYPAGPAEAETTSGAGGDDPLGLADQRVLLSQIGDQVLLTYRSSTEAAVAFDWLERIACDGTNLAALSRARLGEEDVEVTA